MDAEQSKARAARYLEILATTGMKASACEPRKKGPGPEEMAAHAMWMCQQVPRLCVEGKPETAAEWIRFVEGVLWSSGVMSFEDMTRDGIAPGILLAR